MFKEEKRKLAHESLCESRVAGRYYANNIQNIMEYRTWFYGAIMSRDFCSEESFIESFGHESVFEFIMNLECEESYVWFEDCDVYEFVNISMAYILEFLAHRSYMNKEGSEYVLCSMIEKWVKDMFNEEK
jgi:hypothetical protein